MVGASACCASHFASRAQGCKDFVAQHRAHFWCRVMLAFRSWDLIVPRALSVPATFLVGSTLRACSTLCTSLLTRGAWTGRYDKRYTESYGPYNLDKALAGTHCAAPIMSQAGWRRYSSTCLSLCRANQDLLQSSGTDDRGAKIRAGFDMAVFAVLAGHPCLPEDASDSNATSAGLRHGSFLADADPRASLVCARTGAGAG